MSTTNEIMVLTGDGYGIQISPRALEIKENLLIQSAAVVAVTNATENTVARAHIGQLANIRIQVEKVRKTVKEPVLELGKRIDSAAKDFLGQLADEETRITNLIGSYAKKVEAERQAAERARQEAERERLRQELIAEAARRREEEEAARQAAQAEAARRAAEEAEFAAALGDSAEETAAAEEAAKQAEHEAMLLEKRQQDIAIAEAERQRQAEEASKLALEAALTAKASAPVEGVKFEIDFEVTNLDELYQADSSLVTLTARRADILAVLKGQQQHGMKPGLPGIIVTQKAKISK